MMNFLRFCLLCCLFSIVFSTISAQTASLSPSLELRESTTQDGSLVMIPWQATLPLRSFEPQERTQLSLAGSWQKARFEADADLSMSLRDENTLAALESEIAGRHLPDYDASSWESIDLPAVENEMPLFAAVDAPEDYQNGVYYRRDIDIPASWEGSFISLNFLSVNYVADVWINGEWLGYHEGGFTPFSFDVSHYLRLGATNTFFIRVDNPEWGTRSDTVPAVKPDWWNYTGVIHDFYLEASEPLYVSRADVLTENLDGTLSVETVLHNTSAEAQTASLGLSIYSTDRSGEAWLNNPLASAIIDEAVLSIPAAELQIEAGQVLVISQTIQIPDPALWSPESPNLYVLQASLNSPLGTDVFSTQFGIRSVSTDSHRLLLNEQQIFLAGVARHEEDPATGRTMSWEIIRRDLEIIQALNANFVRTAHYPNHIYTYLLTDRLGLLAAVEIPLWQATALEYQVQEERLVADQMWREMIFSNRNRPSIILWSTNNESREVPFRSAYNERLVNDFHENYDDGRLVMQSAAADSPGISDSSQNPLDVAGWTMYFGIFHGGSYYEGTRDFLLAAHNTFPDRPILNTEYGIWSAGNMTMRTQAEVFSETFRALSEVTALDLEGNWREDGFLAGITWWAAFDWYTAHTGVQTMGLYLMDRRTMKPAGLELRNSYAVWNQNE